jgi:hypothetical protein
VFGTGGGGVLLTGTGALSIYNSSIIHNQAGYSGGGIRQNGSNSLSIYNCTIAGNLVTNTPQIANFPHGGGIAVSLGTLNLYHSTIASNSAPSNGGGIGNIVNPGKANIYNSILAGGSAGSGPDVAGSFASGGYNLVLNTNGSTGFTNTSDQVNVNPLLGPLADYGGPTPSMALRVGSPAMDKGKSFGSMTDQRGFARPLDDLSVTNASGGDGADIGAFEVDPNFRIVDLRRVGSNVALSMMTVLGETYWAEYANDLPTVLAPGFWLPLTNNVPGNGWLLWVTNSGANQPRRFYRGGIGTLN